MRPSAASSAARPASRPASIARAQWPVALALALPLLAFALQGRYGLSLLDEGFVWYGAQRVLAGEVPLRDFQAYDIGRYYWSAAWMLLAGHDGIVPLRAGNAVLAACTVALAAVLVGSRPRQPVWAVALAAVCFAAWMVPDFKVADNFAALLLVAGLARALHRNAPRRWAELGVCLGVAATIGINHGLYGTVAVALALVGRAAVGSARPGWRGMLALGLGSALGYAPVLACHFMVPGFTVAFVDSIRMLFETGTTNLALPLPRLSAVFRLEGQRLGQALRESVLALVAIAATGFVLLCLWRLWRDRASPQALAKNPAFAAAVLLCVPYAHYAYSRTDFVHTAVTLMPVLIAVWTYPARDASRARRAALAFVVLCTALLVPPEHRGYPALAGRPLHALPVRGEVLKVDPLTADELRLLQRLADAHAPGQRAFYAVPYWPGAYAALGRRSPTWEIYALFSARPERQRREIERLEAADIGFAVVSGWRIDGRTDLGFENTHPLIAQHLRRCLRPAPLAGTEPVRHVQIFIAGARGCTAE